MAPSETYLLEMAALLHDIGMIGVPDAILHKPGKLTGSEWQVMRRHNEIGVVILEEGFGCKQLSELVHLHHAWFGGREEDPSLPTGESIPLGARILSIAEAYDSMISGSVYTPALTTEQAFEELRSCAGTQFDPQLVENLIAEISTRDSIPGQGDETVGESNITASVAGSAEDLARAMENHDRLALLTMAQCLQRSGAAQQATSLCQAAEKLARVAARDGDIDELAKTASELLDVCRSVEAGRPADQVHRGSQHGNGQPNCSLPDTVENAEVEGA
jgi:hypothetical protein